MDEKTFGDLKVGDKIYIFDTTKEDNCIIKNCVVESITNPFELLINIDGIHEVILSPAYNVVERNGIIYATSKSIILNYLKDRYSMMQSNIDYYKRQIEEIKSKIVKCEQNIQYYMDKKSDIFLFYCRLKDIYNL